VTVCRLSSPLFALGGLAFVLLGFRFEIHHHKLLLRNTSSRDDELRAKRWRR
jgi:hypothetical protein